MTHAMTKQEIIELLKTSKWKPSNSKLFTDDEFSETLAIWDESYAFSMHCIRNKNFKDAISLVVTQIRPILKFSIPFDTIEHILNTNSMKHMWAEQLLNNKEEHNNFLNILNYDDR